MKLLHRKDEDAYGILQREVNSIGCSGGILEKDGI